MKRAASLRSPQLPNLKALAVLETAVRHGGFSAAAGELNIAQSAVSRHIANLEVQTGLQLFRRRGNRISATEAGVQLADAVRAGLGGIRRKLDELTAVASDVLLIGCSHDVAQVWLLPRFALINAATRGRQVRLLSSTDYASFDRSGVELSIRFGTPDQWPGKRAVRLIDGQWFPVCAPSVLASHPQLAGSDPRRFEGVPLLHLSQDAGTPYDWRRWLGDVEPAGGPIFSSYLAVLHEALAGRGVALAWAGFVEEHLERGQLVRLSPEVRTSPEAFHLVTDLEPHPVVAALVESLVASAAAGLAGTLNAAASPPTGPGTCEPRR